MEGVIGTNEREKTSQAEMVQWGRLVGAVPRDRPRVGLRPQRPWICLRSPTNRKSDCPRLVQVLGPSPPELWRVPRDVIGSAIVRSGAVAVSEY